MVHDLKNIAAELELVARNAERHRDKAEFLDDAFATVANSSGSIRRLLDQLRNRRVTPEKKVTIDLVRLVDAVVGKRAGRLPMPELVNASQGCTVVAEQGRLENVLKHLIDNACEATGEQGSVRIRFSATSGERPVCVVEIVDDGRGMEADFIRDRLFKPFDTTKGNAGMGIGMYESREFIRELDGDIQVSSEPGRGTTVSVTIPVG
jgi:putative PEP-CTERM system histidine kinase